MLLLLFAFALGGPSDYEALKALYDATGGAAWLINRRWNMSNADLCKWNLTDSCLGEYCVDSYISLLLNCTTPTSHVTRLQLESNNLRGFIPTELGLLTKLSMLTLPRNFLSGTIPSELGLLEKLSYLDLGSNDLSGAIPSEIGNLAELGQLRLSFNVLSSEIPESVRVMCEREYCWGLPPAGCSAFGSEYSREAGGTGCVQCPSGSEDYTLRSVAPFLGVVLFLCISAGAYVWAVQRFPYFKGWIATSSIILAYMQICYQLAGELRGVGGPLLDVVHATVSFASFEFSSGRPECLFPPLQKNYLSLDDEYAAFELDVHRQTLIELAPLVFVGFLLAALTVLLCLSVVYGCRRRPQADTKSDSYVDKAIIVYSLQISPAFRATMFMQTHKPVYNTGHLVFVESWYIYIAFILAEILLGLWMIASVGRMVRAKRRRPAVFAKMKLLIARVQHRNGSSPAPVGELTPNQIRVEAGPRRRNRLLVAMRRSCSATSSQRQARRLRYLTSKYGDHAPYWQFVKWSCSWLFILARCLPLMRTANRDVDDWREMYRDRLVEPNWRPLAQALGSLAVLIVFALLHVRVQPYAAAHQNRLELVLLVSSICVVALSCAYPALQGDDAARLALDVVVVLLMLGPLATLCAWWAVDRFKRCQRDLTDIETSEC